MFLKLQHLIFHGSFLVDKVCTFMVKGDEKKEEHDDVTLVESKPAKACKKFTGRNRDDRETTIVIM